MTERSGQRKNILKLRIYLEYKIRKRPNRLSYRNNNKKNYDYPF
jgi:hypothetical protein